MSVVEFLFVDQIERIRDIRVRSRCSTLLG